MLKSLWTSLLVIFVLVGLVACSPTVPGPTLKQSSGSPTSSAPGPTLGQPKGTASETASPTPIAADALETTLSGAGFDCSGADANNYNCGGIDQGNSYSISINASANVINNFTLLVSNSDGAAQIDQTKASAYLGSVLDLLTAGADGQTQMTRAFTTIGANWTSGSFIIVAIAPDPTSLGASGSVASALAGKIIVPGSSLVPVFSHLAYTCAAPVSDPTGYSLYTCQAVGSKVSYQVTEDGAIHSLSVVSSDLVKIKAVISALFLSGDAASINTWLDGAGASGQKSLGAYNFALTAVGGHTLTLTATP